MRARQAEDAAPGHVIEVRHARRLERRLAAQRGDRLVGHPIAPRRRRTSWAIAVSRAPGRRPAVRESAGIESAASEFAIAVSGSLRPWPVSVSTSTSPGAAGRSRPCCSAPARLMADAGSANTPSVRASRRYAARMSSSSIASIAPPDSSRAADRALPARRVADADRRRDGARLGRPRARARAAPRPRPRSPSCAACVLDDTARRGTRGSRASRR